MSVQTETRLTPRQRLTRGLTYSVLGPVDVTRGVVGLGIRSARSTASVLRRHYRQSGPASEFAATQETIAQELAAAQEVVASLSQRLRQARRSQCRHAKRSWIIAGISMVVLVGGAMIFSIFRHSSRPEPSPRPPSVDVQPRP
ncbi:cell wall synthesis protein CwsA [Mycobacterium uberis]|uniref:Cell wall synthesis protein CwsA n=1 Tax=Mycobacterium uberis TaxID=2162698 RepID=A0A3E1HL68_9MYCO|nr:cell wall synthesis protein CwsA [Mycobacterium uberis]RFD27233.1 cell wall synthesis protein CwsA [Mycobacterium uberis]